MLSLEASLAPIVRLALNSDASGLVLVLVLVLGLALALGLEFRV